MAQYDMITVLGPTASGKTRLAVALADRLDGEILSADSRQVYRGMDIGTGKDLGDYILDGRAIPYHLIDIADAGTKYNVYEFQGDFKKAYTDIVARKKFPVMCGGTGLYLESVLKGYRLIPVPENPELRRKLEGKSLKELTRILEGYKTLHNTTDIDTAKRAIRAIEIEECYRNTPVEADEFPHIDSLVIGVDIDRELRRQRISRRLEQRLDEGMVDEVRHLLDSGIPPEDLIYYGLEYKYVTLYLTGQLPYKYMQQELEVAIHQFAKRQMTWFRGMERRGTHIEWVPFEMDMAEKTDYIVELMKKKADD
ncbi:MAG: tRNA (adenosine(37)-N6)-dimethylallyltransferase MiaA [Bacteroidaceae bacterium]|nr:tRNA (adenosine(37)-N6)-dimethylallyltransferase MiaA [Bacteroidaceae bacterium]